MASETLFYTSEAVRDFIINNFKGSHSKDYEFLAALLLCRFCEKQWNDECEIGFEFKQEYTAKIPKFSLVNLDKITELFRKGIDEDTPTDCTIVTGNSINKGKRPGLKFQVKRFGIGRTKKDTAEFIEFINSLLYQKSPDIALMVCIDKGVEVEFPKVREHLNPNVFPFNRLMFMGLNEGRVSIGEIYPQYGMEEYSLDEMV